MLRFISFFVFICLALQVSFAQVRPVLKVDTVIPKVDSLQMKKLPFQVEKDTTQIFSNLKEKNKGSKIGRLFNRLVYKSNKRLVAHAPEVQVNRHLDRGEGKIIRNINITTLDPFGYSEKDSLKKPTKSLEIWGNRAHLKTKKFTIRNFLLFTEGDVFDSLKVKESERLIRTQRYVRRVLITAVPTASPDSIDVSIRELDSWTIYPSGSISTSSMRLKLTDRNFGGFGHDVTVQYITRFKENRQGAYFSYSVNNIQNTFIRSNILFNQDAWGNYVKGVSLNRPFYSPYAKWAGGVSAQQRFRRDSLPDQNMKYSLESVKYNTYDYWAGYSIPVETKSPIITNLRTSLRFVKENYHKTPGKEYDPYDYYRDQRLYLASVSLTSTNYIQDRFIFNYDIIEDVQVGKILALTGGMRDKYNKRRAYFGARFAMGGYTKLGYFAGNIEWGGHFHGGKTEQAAFRLEGTYFTRLFVWGDWRFRHFFVPQLVVGSHRYDHIGDELRIEGIIQGIRAQKITGTKRLSLAYQWQSYAPYEWKGFRFNPYFSFEGAFIGDSSNRLLDPKLYSRFSLGLVANNDYLVFSKVTVSLVYYPTMPDSGNSVFRANSVQYNMELPNFNYDRPQTVSYY
ncbi:hypothetical protein M2306_000254 [Myroides gitamensis]|uniref:hypothetical protein n=1 Tax=Myroides odoratus TaxID=256 RepID=UPI002169C812|nr:hypothetical protein [Myroides odoratus]MCS4239140.1 hypothetical protein [Myroides odoratus]MDH6599560.1 hypothetical protein [Myroides gitamensis]